MEKWTLDPNDENEPEVKLNIPNGEFIGRRDNMRLYTHLGQLALYDHVFCSQEESGFYIFNFVGGYETLKEYMLQNAYPAYVNQTEVAQVDVDAFDRAMAASTNDLDYLPDDWQ